MSDSDIPMSNTPKISSPEVERPSKKRKVMHISRNSNVLQFLDIEAAASDGEDEGHPDGDLEDLFDDDEPEPIPGDPHSAHQLILHESLHPSDDEPFWTNFLARAKARLGPRVGHLPQVEDDADKCDELERRIELASSTDTKSLWVVVVTPGYEEHAVFRVYKRLVDARFPSHLRAPCVFGWTSLPGRIFFEAASQDIVRDICEGLPNVFSSKITPISVDPRVIFNVPDTYRPRSGGWVRLSKGLFKGDIAFVTRTSLSLLVDVLVVPRVVYEPSHKKGAATTVELVDLEKDSRFAQNYNPRPELLKKWGSDRPSQSLFSTSLAQQRYPRALRSKNRLSLFKGVLYDHDGYAILKALDTDRYTPEDAIPTAEEYSLFSACSSIPADARQRTIEQITSKSFRLDDAVKVIDGNSKGLFGRIIALREKDADLFLPLEGLTSTIPLASLRKHLRIGDEVRVESGTQKGITGWVVNLNDNSVWVYNHEAAIEIETSTYSVVFYSPPRIFGEHKGLSITTAQGQATKGLLDKLDKIYTDPNRYLVGKHVVVTAGNFKSYQGIVKSTLRGGKVLVELEAHLQRQEPFDVRSLHLLADYRMSKIENRDSSPGPSAPATSSGSSTTSAILPLHSIPTSAPHANVASTPLPAIEDIPMSPAWNPGSRTPNRGDNAPPPYWLAESCFNGMRISLRILHSNPDFHNGKYENKRVEFKGVVGDMVKVTVMWETIEVPFEYLVPDIPSQVQEIGVAFEGPHKGKKFKIMDFKHDVCGCSNWESATRRRRVDVKIPTEQLVVVYR